MANGAAKARYMRWMIPEDLKDRACPKAQMADVLGVSITTLDRWEKDQTFQTELRKMRVRAESDPNFYELVLREKAMHKLADTMTRGSESQARMAATSIIEKTQDAADAVSQKRVDFSDMSDADLLAAIMGKRVTTPYSEWEVRRLSRRCKA